MLYEYEVRTEYSVTSYFVVRWYLSTSYAHSVRREDRVESMPRVRGRDSVRRTAVQSTKYSCRQRVYTPYSVLRRAQALARAQLTFNLACDALSPHTLGDTGLRTLKPLVPVAKPRWDASGLL